MGPFPQHNLEVLEGKNHGTSSVSHISGLMGSNEFSTLQMSMTSDFITSFHKVEKETTETVTVASLSPEKIISVKTTANSSPSPQRPGKKKSRGSESCSVPEQVDKDISRTFFL